MFCTIAFVLAMVAVYLGYGDILAFLERPYCQTLSVHATCALYVTGPLDGFSIRLDVTGYGALVVSSPLMIFQLWRFVTPGLHAHERRYAVPFVFAVTSLFATGAAVAWLTFPHAIAFLHSVGGPGIRDIFTPGRYIGLILSLMAIFGLTFEFPAVLVALEIARVVTSAALVRARRGAIVAIVALSAVITPSSDPFSMMAMALPMLLFYEMAIIVGKMLERRRVEEKI